MKQESRTIVVKTLLRPSEFLAFEAACIEQDIPQSKCLRDLANDFTTNFRRDGYRRESPIHVHKRHISCPSKPRTPSSFRLRQ